MAWIEESELPDVPAIFQAMSLKPEALDAVKRLNEVLSFGNSGLSRVQEEAIATVVSVAIRCRYGAMTHAGFLRRHSQDLEMASHFLSDYTQAPLSSTDRRILDFAVQVTQVPSALTKNDVEQLRDAGLEESQILDVVLIACLSNFMDRLANSLGVDLEPRHRRALENWLTGPAAQQDWLMSSSSQSPPATPTKNNSPWPTGNPPPAMNPYPKLQSCQRKTSSTLYRILRCQYQPIYPSPWRTRSTPEFLSMGRVQSKKPVRTGGLRTSSRNKPGARTRPRLSRTAKYQRTRWRKMQPARKAAANPRITPTGNRGRVCQLA